MFKQITNLDGNEWYLIVSLLIFMVFFIVVGIMLWRMNKDYINYMKDIPLDSGSREVDDEQTELQ